MRKGNLLEYFRTWSAAAAAAAAAADSLQLCPTRCNPTDSSPWEFPWSGLPLPSPRTCSHQYKKQHLWEKLEAMVGINEA